MSQARPIRCFPVWQADPAGDPYTSIKGTLKSFTFDLVEDPGALAEDAKFWSFEGPNEKSGKWVEKGTVPWAHAKPRVITDAVDLDSTRRLPAKLVNEISDILGYKFIHRDRWLIVALKGTLTLAKLYTCHPLAIQPKDTPGTYVRISMDDILAPAFRKEGIASLENLSPADKATLETKAIGNYKPQGDYTIRHDVQIANPAMPAPGTHTADDGGWGAYATAHDPSSAAKYGVGDTLTVCVYLDGKALRGHPTTGTITGRGDKIRLIGEHTDRLWPPATRVNGQHCTWTFERTTPSGTRETEEWAQPLTEFDPEDMQTWSLLFEQEREVMQQQIKQLLYARASELGVMVREDTPLWTAIRACLDFCDVVYDLDEDWRKNERLAKWGYNLQQELRIQLYGAKGYSMNAMRTKMRGTTTKTDPVSLSLKEQDKDRSKNGGRAGLTWGGYGRGGGNRGGYGNRGGGYGGGRGIRGACYNCNETGHRSIDCPQMQKSRASLAITAPGLAQPTGLVQSIQRDSKTIPACTFCNAPFHTADKCWRNPASSVFRGPNTPAAFAKTGFRDGGAQQM